MCFTGAVSTEFIVVLPKKRNGLVAISDSLTGWAISRCALMEDDLMARTGSIQWVEDLIEEFDLYDENGSRQQKSMRDEFSGGENHRWAPDLQQ